MGGSSSDLPGLDLPLLFSHSSAPIPLPILFASSCRGFLLLLAWEEEIVEERKIPEVCSTGFPQELKMLSLLLAFCA